MSLTTREILTRIEDAIDTTIGPDGWFRSPYMYDLHPLDTRPDAHLSWAVGVLSTAVQQRGRDATVVVARTSIGVRWSHRLRLDAQQQDYREALTAEVQLIAAAQSAYQLGLHVVEARRGPTAGDGTLLRCELLMELVHTWSLTT